MEMFSLFLLLGEFAVLWLVFYLKSLNDFIDFFDEMYGAFSMLGH